MGIIQRKDRTQNPLETYLRDERMRKKRLIEKDNHKDAKIKARNSKKESYEKRYSR